MSQQLGLNLPRTAIAPQFMYNSNIPKRWVDRTLSLSLCVSVSAAISIVLDSQRLEGLFKSLPAVTKGVLSMEVRDVPVTSTHWMGRATPPRRT